jgi:hypothetical protein
MLHTHSVVGVRTKRLPDSLPTAHKLCLVNPFTNPTSNRAPVNPRKHADCTFPSLTTHFSTDLAVHNSTLWRICSTSRRKRTPPRRVPAI